MVSCEHSGARRLVGRRLPECGAVVLLLALLLSPGRVSAWSGTEWASSSGGSCSASSSYFSCSGAYDAPDVTGSSCGNWNTPSWTTENSGTQWLKVFFGTPLYVSGVDVYETYAYGRLTSITLIDSSDVDHVVWSGTDATTCTGTTSILARFTWDTTDYLVKGVKLTFSSAGAVGVDAVGLVGSDSLPTATPTITPTAEPTATPTITPTATATSTAEPTAIPTATPLVVTLPTATPFPWSEQPTPYPTAHFEFGLDTEDMEAFTAAVQANPVGLNTWPTISEFGVISGGPVRIVVPSVKVPGTNISVMGLLFGVMAGFAVYLVVRLVMQLIP